MTAQSWDPARYQRDAGYVARLGEPLLDLLAPRPGELILDLGCGDGALTEKVAARGARVIGIDASRAQIAAARARGLEALVCDGHRLAFGGGFHGVVSNAALHWMTQPDAVIAGVWSALAPGGRFVGEMGGFGNVAKVRAALHAALARRGLDPEAADPWYFPTPEDYGGRLARHGFQVAEIALMERPTPIPGAIADWLETFAQSFLNLLPEGARPALHAELHETLAPDLRDETGLWTVDYVRLRFVACKPASSAAG